eukprot:TRINITY_DN28382_c0_g1_i3.p1 TRINITY_DN28382_c0_g1~~TRINITY_DN28382_c0_g1_i3.p1  ORF type:complete len:106 (-),score=16.26 TRINITY_DN28382_c0_g1_i3:183-500(-)
MSTAESSFKIKSINVVARAYPWPLHTAPMCDAWQCGLCRVSLGVAPSVEPEGDWRGVGCAKCKATYHKGCRTVFETTHGTACPGCDSKDVLKEFPLSTVNLDDDE